MLQLIAGEKITVVGAVPTQWERLLRLAELETTDLSHVRIWTSATAPIRPEVVEEITGRMGFPLVVRYAMTESPTICGTEPEDPPDGGAPARWGARSLAWRCRSLRRPARSGRSGSGACCVMRGYWNAPELTRKAFDDEGWLVSGDLAHLREGREPVHCRPGHRYVHPRWLQRLPRGGGSRPGAALGGGVGERGRRAGAADRRDRRRLRRPRGWARATRPRRSCGSWSGASSLTTRRRTGWRSSTSCPPTRCSRSIRTPCASWPPGPDPGGDPCAARKRSDVRACPG